MAAYAVTPRAIAQITFREVKQKEAEPIRPGQFDSLSNLGYMKAKGRAAIEHMLSYVGQEVVMMPASKQFTYRKDYKKFIASNIYKWAGRKPNMQDYQDPASSPFLGGKKSDFKHGVSYSEIEGRFFYVDQIYWTPSLKSYLHSISAVSEWTESSTIYYFVIQLREKETGDIYFYKVNGNGLNFSEIAKPKGSEANPGLGMMCFFTSYIQKAKELFVNKNYVAYDDWTGPTDIDTGDPVVIKKGSVWECSEVSLVEIEDNFFMTPAYILKNKATGQTIMSKLGRGIYDGIDKAHAGIFPTAFMEEGAYREMKEKERLEEQLAQEKAEAERLRIEKERELWAQAKLKKEQERVAEEKARQQKLNAQRAQFKKDMIAKYGEEIGNVIIEGRVRLGMTAEMCRASWGRPESINRTSVEGLVSEQWVYGGGNYLYFDNGILTSIQN